MNQVIEDALELLHQEFDVPSHYQDAGSAFFDNKLMSFGQKLKTSKGDHTYEHLMDFLIGHFIYFRIGDILIANETTRPILIDYVDSKDIIFMSKQGSFMENPMILPRTAAALHAISSLDLNGAYIVENGAADGLLSVVSKKRGAKMAYPIEIDSNWKGVFESHLMANSLRNPGLIVENLETYNPKDYFDCRDISVVLSTLGPAYGNADNASINSIGQFPNANVFIYAGINRECEAEVAFPRLELLAKRGFEINERVLFDDMFSGIAYVLKR